MQEVIVVEHKLRITSHIIIKVTEVHLYCKISREQKTNSAHLNMKAHTMNSNMDYL